MPTWYAAKIRFQREQENGSLKTFNEVYLIDAETYTDAEARVYEIVADNTPDFLITNLTRVRLSDVFNLGEEEKWFKCKVVYVSIDEAKGKEKKIVNFMLVNADTPKQAYERIEDALKTMLIPYDITDVNLTPILEVHPYEPKEKVPEGFRPLSEVLAEQ
jgi:Domain of unknown function (DUF4494)